MPIATPPTDDEELDELSIDAVVRHGYRMRLAGADRTEAIRHLAGRGTTGQDIGLQLHIHPDHVRRLAQPAGIRFSQHRPPGHAR